MTIDMQKWKFHIAYVVNKYDITVRAVQLTVEML